MSVHYGIWDVVLLVVVSIQAPLIAYMRNPKWKAIIFSLPIPSTLATMALGHPIDATNSIGLIAFLLYTHGVRWLHQDIKVPIIPSIVLSALGYCVLGIIMGKIIPDTALSFWVSSAAAFVIGFVLYKITPAKKERDYRSLLPIWMKFPMI